MKSALQTFYLDGKKVDAPIEWGDISVTATFEDDNAQPSIEIDQFTLPPESKAIVNQIIADGLNGGTGIFEGIPYAFNAYNNDSTISVFNGYINATNELEDLLQDGKLRVRIQGKDDLIDLNEKIEALTFGYLEAIGKVGLSDYEDVDYVVDKKNNMVDILISLIMIYLLTKELIEGIKRIAKTISEITAHTTGGITGVAAGVAYSIAVIAINLVYTAAIAIAIIKLARNLINTFLPPKRTHKAIKLKRALEIIANHLGYSFVTDIPQMEKVVYLPSNPNLDEYDPLGFIKKVKGIDKGIPNTFDYGYNCGEMYQLAKNTYNAKIGVVGSELHFRTKDDPFWIKQATYSLPDVLLKLKKYNTQDLVFDRIVAFDTDLMDEWTIDNFLGTNYEVYTEPLTVKNKDAVFIKGIEEIRLPVCLGNRKDKLNALEDILLFLAKQVDSLTRILGSGSNLASSVKGKKGMLKISTQNHSKPKLIYLSGDRLASNHRDLWSAKVIYNTFYKSESFVLDNYYGQKIVYDNISIPFGLEDYLKLINNSYFKLKGKDAKITNLNWNISSDRADVSFWVREPYTKNLKETSIEQS